MTTAATSKNSSVSIQVISREDYDHLPTLYRKVADHMIADGVLAVEEP